MLASRQAIEQFGQLLGSNGKMYFGNDDGRFWTDLSKPVPVPPVALKKLQQAIVYERQDGQPLIGSARKIPNSRWLVLVELSGASFMETAHVFLRWVVILGIILIIAGSFGGWLMSRSITRPLKTLNDAASAIANGDYSSLVTISRHDEVGNLAESFNIMTIRVRDARENLVQTVETTTGNFKRPFRIFTTRRNRRR